MPYIAELITEITTDPGGRGYVLPPIIFNERTVKRLNDALLEYDEQTIAINSPDSIIQSKIDLLQSKADAITGGDRHADPNATPDARKLFADRKKMLDSIRAIQLESLHTDSVQIEAAQLIADKINTKDVSQDVTSVPWQVVVNQISNYGSLSIEAITSLNVLKDEYVDPHNAALNSWFSTYSPTDSLDSLKTKLVSLAESNGWRKCKPGHVLAARS